VRSGDRLAMLELDRAAQVLLTHEGRRLLSEHARVLRVEVLPQLCAALEDPERDGRVVAEFDRAIEELRRLTWAVNRAAIAEVAGLLVAAVALERRRQRPPTYDRGP
jgi:hypothetical protein